MRRILDLAISALGLLTLAPFLAGIAFLVKVTSPGPVLYRAERVGKDGRLFTLYKFRSMHVASSASEPRLTRRGDARVTPLGRMLRRLKLDELPQMFNVLRGEMGLVGPRPEDPKYVALYSSDERRVLSVPPGITSPTSLDHRDEEALLDRPDWEEHYTSVVMRNKVRDELEYIDHRTMSSDLCVIARTLLALLRR